MSPDEKKISHMHKYMRPAGSKSEAAFIAKFIDSIPFMGVDNFGNRFLSIPKPDGTPSPILWSSHTDTVHAKPGKQHVVIRPTKHARFLTRKVPEEPGTCLGADCTAGVWLMLEMIEASVPGLYIFHREEEIGGNGSRHIAHETSLLYGIDFAIAFDRRGYDSVITYQFGGRCASERFASQMSQLLGGQFSPDDSGTFTDTANYSGLVSECTNISIGYFGAHTGKESLDLTFIIALRDKLISTDWSELKKHRDPDVMDQLYTQILHKEDFDLETEGDTLLKYVYNYPDKVAAFLTSQGYTLDDLKSTAVFAEFNLRY